MLPKHKIRRPLNQRPRINLIPRLRQQRVLEARKGTPVVPTIRIRAHGHGLTALAEAVIDIDVIQPEIHDLHSEGGGLVVADAELLALGGRDGDRVGRVAGDVGRVPVHGELRPPRRDEDLFRVDARVDEDALRGGGGRVQGVDGGLDGAVGPSRLAYAETAWWRACSAFGCGEGSQGEEQEEGLHFGVGPAPWLDMWSRGMPRVGAARTSVEATLIWRYGTHGAASGSRGTSIPSYSI